MVTNIVKGFWYVLVFLAGRAAESIISTIMLYIPINYISLNLFDKNISFLVILAMMFVIRFLVNAPKVNFKVEF